MRLQYQKMESNLPLLNGLWLDRQMMAVKSHSNADVWENQSRNFLGESNNSFFIYDGSFLLTVSVEGGHFLVYAEKNENITKNI